MNKERELRGIGGIGPLVGGLIVLIGVPIAEGMAVNQTGKPIYIWPAVVVVLLDILFLRGLFIVNPNES
ncbi:MAG TPA: hypothetical protein VMD30_02090, partial [Tepidisphaeraceae bacterium]|nr:hypothetical protein [Tepidisphaeraceae bacterium]